MLIGSGIEVKIKDKKLIKKKIISENEKRALKIILLFLKPETVEDAKKECIKLVEKLTGNYTTDKTIYLQDIENILSNRFIYHKDRTLEEMLDYYTQSTDNDDLYKAVLCFSEAKKEQYCIGNLQYKLSNTLGSNVVDFEKVSYSYADFIITLILKNRPGKLKDSHDNLIFNIINKIFNINYNDIYTWSKNIHSREFIAYVIMNELNPESKETWKIKNIAIQVFKPIIMNYDLDGNQLVDIDSLDYLVIKQLILALDSINTEHHESIEDVLNTTILEKIKIDFKKAIDNKTAFYFLEVFTAQYRKDEGNNFPIYITKIFTEMAHKWGLLENDKALLLQEGNDLLKMAIKGEVDNFCINYRAYLEANKTEVDKLKRQITEAREAQQPSRKLSNTNSTTGVENMMKRCGCFII